MALANRYEHRSPLDLLVPECYRCNEFLNVAQCLVGLTRLNLTTKIGLKTFVALKLYQGVPARRIMQATGHRTAEAFNHYAGAGQLQLVEEFMAQVHAPAGGMMQPFGGPTGLGQTLFFPFQ